jgi:putative nucleotidyltransferase with HDIG domain
MLRDRLESGPLRRLVSQIEVLPSHPNIYNALLTELGSVDASIERVAKIIASDIGMTAKVLQLVNSSFFGLAQRISDPRQAVKRLGIRKLEPLVLTAGVFTQAENIHLRGFDFSAFADHGLAVANRAKQIVNHVSGNAKDAENAFLAGMLHDVGKLVLACNLPEQYQAAIDSATRRRVPLWKAEFETFDASHSEVGAYLVGLWGLPDPIVEAIAFHHAPLKSSPRGFTPLTAVHVANALEHKEYRRDDSKGRVDVDEAYLDALGMLQDLPLWYEQPRSPLAEVVDHSGSSN